MAKIITVLSGKGGVGKSTFCANIGKALSINKKVLLIDGDVAFRSLDILLSVGSQVVFDWSDVIFDRCTKEKALLVVSAKLHLLAAPFSLSENFCEEDFKRLIESFSEMYDYIFIDSPAGFNNISEIYAKVSDEIVVIATPDDISLRAAYIIGEKLINNGIDDNKMRLVLNKADFRQMKNGRQRNLDDAVDKTYLRLLGVIPTDKTLTTVGESDSNLLSSRAKAAFLQIAERILGKDVKLYF
ncbi:MAG: AAA family ATPase [Oscillospiraceae bacterium]|nr:AAA family ATPase [Oscillospiraceae bacterium]